MKTDWFDGENVTTWGKLYKRLETYLKKDKEWAFRGQSSKAWPLRTAIERLRIQFRTNRNDLPEYELKLLREFRRRAHIYHPSPPKEDDHLEWLALLRHHGGPTRLLDFTFSPFIATYFALEGAEKDSAVWAINLKWLRAQGKAVVIRNIANGDTVWENFRTLRDGTSFKEMFWSDPPPRFVRAMTPMRLNERLTLQQGTLLCPGDLTASFEENLKMANVKRNVHKIIISNNLRTEVLAKLRIMNIDSNTLFPSLDGFAQSLNTRFVEIGQLPMIGPEATTV